MDFSVSVEGLDKLLSSSAEIREAVAVEVQKALYASAQKVRTEAIKSILDSSGKAGGRFYKRRSVLHQASAPGEAPSSDTGRLVGSITAYNVGDGEAVTIAGRGTVGYAVMLEFGTSKMAPRPFMFPALEKCRQWISDRLQEALVRGIDKAKR